MENQRRIVITYFEFIRLTKTCEEKGIGNEMKEKEKEGPTEEDLEMAELKRQELELAKKEENDMGKKYVYWLRKAWARLEHDFSTRNFRPQNESDVKCHLYHCLLEERPQNLSYATVMTQYPVVRGGKRNWVDIAILASGRRPLRLPIEIKETHEETKTTNFIIGKITKDIEKMRQAKMEADYRRVRKPVMIYYFWGATEGISAELDQRLKDISKSKDYKDILLLWGPALRVNTTEVQKRGRE